MGSRLRNIQARAAEHGRLRTGYTQGNRPMRSSTWVITSHSEEHVATAAKLWGGEPEQWSPLNSTISQWRVITKASSIEALITPGDPLNQYNEMWSKGGCQRRCDGETELLSRQPCLCARQFGDDWHLQPKGRVCSTTSRLNVMLPDLSGMGMWRAETHSFYAAQEWGGMVDMVLAGTDGRGFVPVTLRIEPRQRVADGQTKKFPVVVVELRGVTPRQALAGPMNAATALDPSATSQARAAIEAPRPDYLADAEAALTVDDVQDVYRAAHAAGHLTDELVAALKKRADEVKADADRRTAGPDEDGAYEAEVVEETAPSWPAVAQPPA
ncbi:recombination directionality factor [Streptomyces rochei]|uniref:recombination directionality factor n=1 Tax=Streptomyces rochei TaxID=1928 RepID=UPI00370205F0